MTWKTIENFPNYQVSDYGQVLSLNFNNTGIPGVLKPGDNKKGGLYFILMKDGVRHVKYLHVLVLETFVGLCPPGLEACHNDGDYTNCALSNLRWDSKLSNAQDRLLHNQFYKPRVTCCPHQHKYVDSNTRIRRRSRECISCIKGQEAKRAGKCTDFLTWADLVYEELTGEKIDRAQAPTSSL